MVAMSRMGISHERLLESLRYNKRTGLFHWRKKRNGARHSLLAGSQTDAGYITIKVDGEEYFAHVLAHFYVTGEWPKGLTDHRNLKKSDNRWVNLRPADNSKNKANGRVRSDNSSGFKGVYRRTNKKYTKPFEAQIRVGGKLHCLGYFRTAKMASIAYLAAAKSHFGEFART